MQPNTINPKDLSIQELKALGYDEVAKIEAATIEIGNAKKNIQAINQELISRETPHETLKMDQGEGLPSETIEDTK